ncbi:MAG: hypothetical protein BroJett040_14840 [Oligoflexia bacterium]|nr:MAG: hypothetical protein BroJett040_14840 [Oligoflexia bacterium]
MLQGHPLIDRVLTTSEMDLLKLKALEFDIGFVVDKSLEASAIARITQIDQTYGFLANPRTGAIEPATPAANELWEIGLSDEKKFFQNKKSEVQLQIEALELGPYQRSEYSVHLTHEERIESDKRTQTWRQAHDQPVIGINTGCSDHLPAKKLSISFHRQIIQEMISVGYKNIVLLGGPEDAVRNQEIGRELGVVQSPTDKGLRDGLVSANACDIILTGDSLGMHMGIGLRKHIIAWFGPTCAHEIELYDRGQVILSKAPCGPCWKRSCQKSLMCYDQVSLDEIMAAISNGTKQWQTKLSSFKQPFSETFFSVSPVSNI